MSDEEVVYVDPVLVQFDTAVRPDQEAQDNPIEFGSFHEPEVLEAAAPKPKRKKLKSNG